MKHGRATMLVPMPDFPAISPATRDVCRCLSQAVTALSGTMATILWQGSAMSPSTTKALTSEVSKAVPLVPYSMVPSVPSSNMQVPTSSCSVTAPIFPSIQVFLPSLSAKVRASRPKILLGPSEKTLMDVTSSISNSVKKAHASTQSSG